VEKQDWTFQAEFGWLNLRDEVENTIRDLGPLASASGTEVRNEVPLEIQVYSDAQLLSQIIQNLLSNALKFTPHGEVEIGARIVGEGSTECWVKDSGEGIPVDQLDKVFERFQTSAEPEKNGIGLGLAIVKEIVELHKGEINVQSQVGNGSTFSFVLPGNTTG
jgi:two-component system, OmpR family, phosphate regulon sensor histidine kinase PhoR